MPAELVRRLIPFIAASIAAGALWELGTTLLGDGDFDPSAAIRNAAIALVIALTYRLTLGRGTRSSSPP